MRHEGLHHGEHHATQSGHARLQAEEARKNSFYGHFHPNREVLHENHGHDRNREGHRDGLKKYE